MKPTAVATVVSLGDGTTSMYLTSGGGMLGLEDAKRSSRWPLLSSGALSVGELQQAGHPLAGLWRAGQALITAIRREVGWSGALRR